MKKTDWFILIFVAIASITLIIIAILFLTQGPHCLSNPISYYENLENMTCNCYPKTTDSIQGFFP